MACITISVDRLFKARMEKFPWVNWSEVGREEAIKREMFERFLENRKLTKEDLEFCDRIDWYPYEELPIRKEYLRKLERLEKGPHSSMTLEELDELMGLG
jgi:hypothetical protein